MINPKISITVPAENSRKPYVTPKLVELDGRDKTRTKTTPFLLESGTSVGAS